MTEFRLDVSRETGAATLWMAAGETACGYKPVLTWPDIHGVENFALMLLEIARRREKEKLDFTGRGEPSGQKHGDVDNNQYHLN
jgi:hypothetical protein